ncbi:MAG: DUF4292 domain-containing protein [Bacteroidota bacterium]
MVRRTGVWGVAVGLVLLGGCGSSSTMRTAGRTVTVEEVFQSVSRNQERLKSMHGEGRLNVETPDFAQSASFTLTLRKPDSILVKINGPFGMDVGSALLTRSDFLFYNSLQNQLISGTMNTANLGRILRLNLTFDEIISLFTGGTFLEDDRDEPDRFNIEDDQFVMTYARASGTRKYWVDPSSLLIGRIQFLDHQGKVEFEQRFTNFRALEGTSVPHSVRITQHRERRTIAISYSSVSVNTGEFQLLLNVPTNAKRIYWQ